MSDDKELQSRIDQLARAMGVGLTEGKLRQPLSTRLTHRLLAEIIVTGARPPRRDRTQGDRHRICGILARAPRLRGGRARRARRLDVALQGRGKGIRPGDGALWEPVPGAMA